MAALKLIGYWRSEMHPEYPDPTSWVDEGWDEDERHQVWFYFDTGTLFRTSMGQAPCRICGVNNGAVEYTDGIYVWPEGLAHYIYDHGVRLPQELVDYALGRLAVLEDREVSTDWWLAAVLPAGRVSRPALPPAAFRHDDECAGQCHPGDDVGVDLDATVLAIARGLVAADADTRARAADEVTDIMRELDPGQVNVLAHLLVAVRVGELEPKAQEAQLHALAELGEWHELLPTVRKLVAQVPTGSVTGSQREYIADLAGSTTSDHPMVRYLVDLEKGFDPGARRSYDPVELLRFALSASDYWAELAVGWLEQGVPARPLVSELAALESEGARPQALRHRVKRLRKSLREAP